MYHLKLSCIHQWYLKHPLQDIRVDCCNRVENNAKNEVAKLGIVVHASNPSS